MPPTAHRLGQRGVRLGRNHGLGTQFNAFSPTRTRTVLTPMSASIKRGIPSPKSPASSLDLQNAGLPFAFNAESLSPRDNPPVGPTPGPTLPELTPYMPGIIPLTELRLPPSVPTPSATPLHANLQPHTPNSIFIVSAILFCVFIGLTVVVLLRMNMKRWGPCVGRIYRRRLRVCGRPHKEGEGKALVTKLEYDDKTWGTPARTPAGCQLPDQFHDHVLQFTSTPALLLEPPRPSASLKTIQEEFDERLRDEEFDIALALDFALRNHSDVPPTGEGAFDFPASCDSPALHNPNGPDSPSCGDYSLMKQRVSCSLSPQKENNCPYTLQTTHYTPPSMRHFDDADDISAMLSLQAGLQSLGRRTRGGGGTAVTPTGMDIQKTSLTHEERKEDPPVTTADNDDDEEEVSEVRHAQSRSVELRKGILLAWPTSEQSISLPPVHPTLVISPPIITFPSPDFAPSASPIEWRSTQAGEAFLRPPGIVYPQLQPHGAALRPGMGLMSSSSSVSIDLDDFPLPPAVTLRLAEGGSFFSDMVDGVGMENARTLADKRTTVEQFIMMYENV